MPLLETFGSTSAKAFGLNSASGDPNVVLYLDAGNSLSYSGSGTTWKDLSYLNKNVTFFRTPTYISSNGGYFSFPGDVAGSRNFAENGPASEYNLTDVTVEVWCYFNSTINQSAFLIEKGVVNTQYAAFLEGGTLRWRLNGSDTLTETGSSYLSPNTWYQLVYTHTPGQQKFYRNSSLQITKTANTNLAQVNDHGFTIGSWRNVDYSTPPSETNHGYYLDGRISIIRVYPKVLTQSEITANFNQFRGRYSI